MHQVPSCAAFDQMEPDKFLSAARYALQLRN